MKLIKIAFLPAAGPHEIASPSIRTNIAAYTIIDLRGIYCSWPHHLPLALVVDAHLRFFPIKETAIQAIKRGICL